MENVVRPQLKHFAAEFWTLLFFLAFNAAYKAWQKHSWGNDTRANAVFGNVSELRVEMEGDQRDYERAAASYRKAADQGVTEAMFHLGRLTSGGLGVPQDYVVAHNWFTKVIAKIPAKTDVREIAHPRFRSWRSQSDEFDQFIRASALARRATLTQVMTKEQFAKTDEYLALQRNKAEQGDCAAQFALALALWKDGNIEFGTESYDEAVSLWRKAATHGDVRAQFNLAYLYASGRQKAIPYSEGQEVSVL